jgi:hypothetical protein
MFMELVEAVLWSCGDIPRSNKSLEAPAMNYWRHERSPSYYATMSATGIVPAKLKMAKVVPTFKSGDAANINNFRPLSLQRAVWL